MQDDRTDQQRFDQEVIKKGRVLLRALAGLGIFAALLMSIIALNNSSERREAEAKPAVTQAAASTPANATASTATASATKPLDVKIAGSVKKGPDGKMHDAFSVTEFKVKVGQPLTLKIDNTDDAPHSISSPTIGVNITAQPGTHTYTLVVSKAGKFEWYCMLPCDSDASGWAMQHPGFMSGYITAT